MLTERQVERVGRLVRLAPYMNDEQREGLLKLVRELKAVDGAAIMPASAVEKMTEAVGDELMRDIVKDLRSGRSEPGFLAAPTGAPAKERGSGWVKPLEHGSPSGQRAIDQMMDVQDALDKRELQNRLRRL
jgi:hypothetical protein